MFKAAESVDDDVNQLPRSSRKRRRHLGRVVVANADSEQAGSKMTEAEVCANSMQLTTEQLAVSRPTAKRKAPTPSEKFEMSLEQRLKEMMPSTSDTDKAKSKERRHRRQTLAALLIQGLHSSDRSIIDVICVR